MPKPSKGTGGAHIRSHSRSSSASKLGANLQFTQKDLPPPKHTDKPKKSTFPHEASTKVPPPFVRLNSNQRVHSKEQLSQASHVKRPAPPLQKPVNGKSKQGFTIASPSENADDDDDWVSSESGAATPSHEDSVSDTSSATDEDPPPVVTQPTIHSDITDQHELTRVDTARPTDFEPPRRDYSTPKPVTPPLQSSAQRPPMISQSPTQPEPIKETTIAAMAPVNRQSPRPSSKRYSRPPSTHSISSRAEHPLRPHPLIRGQSYGQINVILPKPAPLAPLTVIPNAEITHSSPPNGTSHESGSSSQQRCLSSSPTSIKTSSPILPDITSSSSHRRTSFSSTGSINTIPIHSTTSVTAQTPAQVYRNRTLSTLSSSSSSSAALSSLTHLPYVLSHTRPPSPTPHTISFFPPVNPQHASAMEGIHPLLPPPYLSNHLTVLARRTPIRESFDRVIRARSGR
ncbi:hypothetical protein BYT27DRAFT_7130566 [Phlegmacium glaucopus]|nr:hypothetical protein BYT27DRAFT_7130566 [Phlegmacium glaucopus]